MRALALSLLVRVERDGAFADIVLDRAMRSSDIPDVRDRALLTELVMGTLRHRGALDRLVSRHLTRPLQKADPVVRNALRLGAYQLVHLRMPVRAAIFETVEAVKKECGEKPAGVVNAVLRSIDRAGIPEPGEYEADPASCAPPDLFEALSDSIGEEEARAFLAASVKRPPFTVRANTLKIPCADLLARFTDEGFEPSPCRFAPEGIMLAHPPAPYSDPGFSAGEWIVMDEGAQLVAPLLSPRPGDVILDACAAPGGKTTHMAALSGGKAFVTACDVSEMRLRLLRETTARTGAPGISTLRHDFSAGPLPEGAETFDKVLVDAPCTGTGVFRRNPDGIWRFDKGKVAELSRLQRAIVRNAWPSLRPGGTLLYCTCSLLCEENEEVVEPFAKETGAILLSAGDVPGWPGPPGAWTDFGFVRLSPHEHGTDGFFAALLRKPGGIPG